MMTALLETTTTAAPAATSITGRDSYIMLQALLYAVARIQSLPEDRQERSNMVDMCAIARRMGDGGIASLLWSVEHHVGHEIDLWPAHGGDDRNGTYSEEEMDRRNEVRKRINEQKARFEETLALRDAPKSDVVKFIGGGDDAEPEAA